MSRVCPVVCRRGRNVPLLAGLTQVRIGAFVDPKVLRQHARDCARLAEECVDFFTREALRELATEFWRVADGRSHLAKATPLEPPVEPAPPPFPYFAQTRAPRCADAPPRLPGSAPNVIPGAAQHLIAALRTSDHQGISRHCGAPFYGARDAGRRFLAVHRPRCPQVCLSRNCLLPYPGRMLTQLRGSSAFEEWCDALPLVRRGNGCYGRCA